MELEFGIILVVAVAILSLALGIGWRNACREFAQTPLPGGRQ